MILLIITLILLSATFSGLTIGMFSLSVSGLERKIRLGDKKAERVYRIRKNGNYLLCTLLLGNAAVNSAVSISMSEVSSGVMAGVISTGLIFVFGEVLPQAVFSRHALNVGYYTSWLVQAFMFLMWPIAKPLSILLDKLLGKEFPELFDKHELRELLLDHSNVDGTIDGDERRIMVGAMRFSEKTAHDVLTPASILFYLDQDLIINGKLLMHIRSEHYSRIPVCMGTRDNIVGILYAKDLIGLELNNLDVVTVGDLCKKENLLFVREGMHLDSLMNHFLKTKTHMAFVYDAFGVLQGIATLEDVMEEVLDIEILDETDTVADL